MKILEIAPGNLRGGAETVQVHLFRELIKRPEVTVHTLLFSHGALEDALIRENVPVEVVPVRFRSFSRDVGEVRRLVNTLQPEIIHSHNFKSNILGAVLSPKDTRLVATVHGPIEPMRGFRNVKMEIYQKANGWFLRNRFDRVVVVSRALAHHRLLAGVPLEKLALIHNGIPMTNADSTRAPRGENVRDGGFTIGAIGRLEIVKGFDVLIEAFSSALPKLGDAKLLIFGEGPERSNLEQLAKSKGIEARTEFMGFDDNLQRTFSRLDLLVMPSLDEGLPLALLEAMSCEVPVLASSVGEIPRVLDDGAAGLLVSPGNPDELAGRLVEARHSADLKNLSRRALDIVRNNYSSEKMAEQYLDLFQSLSPRSS